MVEEHEVPSALEMMDLLDPLKGALTHGSRFRGHGSSDWKLEASLFREARRLGHAARVYNEKVTERRSSFEIDLLFNFFLEADSRGFDIPRGGDHVVGSFKTLIRGRLPRRHALDGDSWASACDRAGATQRNPNSTS